MIDLNTLDRDGLCQLFDHTFLKAYARKEDFEKLCREANDHHFRMVAINSYPVSLCKKLLQGTDVHVGAAIGFPLGQTDIETKCFETRNAIENGADEIDYVLNIGKLRDHDFAYIEEEMSRIVSICREHGVLVKVIFENCYLDKEEIIAAAKIAGKIRPDFIKTSTGFGTGGATAEDVRLMKETVGDSVKVKAAGGIRDWPTCRQMILAGAERIGTSASIAILQGFLEEKESQR